MRALNEPAADSAKLEKIYEQADDAFQTVRDNPAEAFAEGDDDPFKDVNAALSEYGLTDCAS